MTCKRCDGTGRILSLIHGGMYIDCPTCNPDRLVHCGSCRDTGSTRYADPETGKWVTVKCLDCAPSETPDPKPDPKPPLTVDERRHRETLIVIAMSNMGWIFDKEKPGDEFNKAKRLVDYVQDRMRKD